MHDPSYEKAIIGILSDKKTILATGFYIFSDGYALTCYHAIESLPAIKIIDPNDIIHEAKLQTELSSPKLDIAVLKIETMEPVHYIPLTLRWETGDEIWSTGYHYFGTQIRKPLPIAGKIQGITSISFKKVQTYTLRKVLKLEGTIEEGISGAPLVLNRDKKAAAIINANFKPGGFFGVPFDSISEVHKDLFIFVENIISSQEKEALTSKNNELKKVLLIYTQFVLQRLSDKGLYLPEQFCKRNYLAETVEQFLASNDKLLIVTGGSGVGKTSALAHIAAQLSNDNAVIFYPAYQASLSTKGLKEEILNDLDVFLENEKTINLSIMEIEETLTLPQTKIVIIVDGINEIRITDENMFITWVDRTISWLKKRNIQLILSSRPDFWEHHKKKFPQDVFYKPVTPHSEEDPESNDSKWFSLNLNDFDNAEFNEALKTYHLPSFLKENNNLKHPLLLRIFWELKMSQKGGTSYHKLFKNFTREKCASIAIKNGTSEHLVYNKLLNLIKIIANNDYWIEEGEYYNVFESLYFLPDAFLNENIVAKSDTGIRIMFDQLAEYLTSELFTIDLSNFSWKEVFAEWNAPRRKALPWNFAKLETTADISNLLNKLADDRSIKLAIPTLLLFNNIITLTEKPENYFGSIEKTYLRLHQGHRNFHNDYLISNLLSNTRLSHANYLRLIQIGLCNENYYPWETKHWIDLSFDGFDSENFRSFGRVNCILLLKKELSEHFHETITIVSTWLQDTTELSSQHQPSQQAKIHDIAAAVLFHYRRFDFRYVVDLITKNFNRHNYSSRENYLLQNIAEKSPIETISVLLEWYMNRQRISIVVFLSSCILKNENEGEPYKAYTQALSEIINETNDTQIHLDLLTGLIQVPSYRAEMIKRFFILYEAGKFNNFYLISPYINEYFALIFPKIKEYIGGTVNNYVKGECFMALLSARLKVEYYSQVVDFANEIFSLNPEYARIFFRGIEDLLYHLPFPSIIYDQTLELAKKGVSKLNPENHTSLVYYVCSNLNSEKEGKLIEIIRWLINEPNFKDNLEILCNILIKNAFDDLGLDKIFRLLKEVLIKNNSQTLIDGIMSQIYLGYDSKERDHLFMLLITDPSLADYGKREELADLVTQGIPVHDAIERVVLGFS